MNKSILQPVPRALLFAWILLSLIPDQAMGQFDVQFIPIQDRLQAQMNNPAFIPDSRFEISLNAHAGFASDAPNTNAAFAFSSVDEILAPVLGHSGDQRLNAQDNAFQSNLWMGGRLGNVHVHGGVGLTRNYHYSLQSGLSGGDEWAQLEVSDYIGSATDAQLAELDESSLFSDRASFGSIDDLRFNFQDRIDASLGLAFPLNDNTWSVGFTAHYSLINASIDSRVSDYSILEYGSNTGSPNYYVSTGDIQLETTGLDSASTSPLPGVMSSSSSSVSAIRFDIGFRIQPDVKWFIAPALLNIGGVFEGDAHQFSDIRVIGESYLGDVSALTFRDSTDLIAERVEIDSRESTALEKELLDMAVINVVAGYQINFDWNLVGQYTALLQDAGGGRISIEAERQVVYDQFYWSVGAVHHLSTHVEGNWPLTPFAGLRYLSATGPYASLKAGLSPSNGAQSHLFAAFNVGYRIGWAPRRM